MTTTKNPLDELLPPVKATYPPREPIQGNSILLRPLQPSDSSSLYTTLASPSPTHDALWTFMPDGPFASQTDFEASITAKSSSTDPLFFAVQDLVTGNFVGHVSFMRIDMKHRTIELGYLIFSDTVHRSRITTETIYLMMRMVFDHWGFRRCEWKCDNRNEPSKRAATRFGFVFEGVFRQHYIVKGRNRDSAWFAVLDGEWERGGVKEAFEVWLREENFDVGGRQKRRLEDIRKEVRGRLGEDVVVRK